MDRPAPFIEQRIFFSTSRREAGLEPVDAPPVVPAALAPFRDLVRLRHDFPIVLSRSDRGEARPVESLSELVDRVLRDVAPRGMAGERLRKHALALEREIRTRVLAGADDALSGLWEEAAANVGAPAGEGAEEVLRYTAAALKTDGALVACDAAMPAKLLVHEWELAHAQKAQAFRKIVDTLATRLHDILRAAYVHSAAGTSARALERSMAAPRAAEFDFEALSRLVSRSVPRDELPAARRERIEWALRALLAQRFYPDPKGGYGEAPEAYGYRFASCWEAAEAFRERLPALVQAMKAIAIAELEADNRYDDATHDAFFEGYGEASLTPEDVALFPDYLVCIPPGANAGPDNANLMEMLSSGLPVKVLVEAGDALEEAAIGAGRFAFGVRANRLAMTATSLGGVFVLQAPGSELYRLRERVAAGLAHRGPALFSVFAGADAPAAGLAPYLTAAAALRSRAFPAFSYDPLAGDNMAARFCFEDDPDPEADWPAARLEYSDEQMQRVAENPAFTFADFALCDTRYAAHFARVSRERWNASMMPLAGWLALDAESAAQCVPFVLAVDAENRLHRVLVDERMALAARRCLTLWHRLQELGGINNSYAKRAVAQLASTTSDTGVRPRPDPEPTPAPAAPAAVEETGVRPASDPDQPWIETARCPSCNECQLVNDKLFLYNENKQAYLGKLEAGTYRQMVEAAEACQVSIIHPGKPWNPNEPGLAELVERAQPFQ
jgi:hypothetical protein